MTAKARVRAAVLATFIVVLGTVGVATKQFGTTATASPSASLTVFVGDVQVQAAGASTWLAGHTGDSLAQGGRVKTGPDSKAALTLPDGSVTRLDASTELQITTLGRASKGGYSTSLFQASGATWNSVRQLVSGSRYSVRAPNNSTAEVRGTDFSFVVDPVDTRVNVWAGAVVVTGSNNSEVTVPTGEATVVHQNSVPEQPKPISIEDKRSTFTVFNQTVQAVGHTPTTVKGDSAVPGAVSAVLPAATVKNDSDLTFSLGWPGSTFELIVIAPGGSVYASRSSSQPPVTLVVPHAQPGNWSYQVRDIESDPSEAYWVIVSSTKPQTTGSTSGNSNGSTISSSPGGNAPRSTTKSTRTPTPTPEATEKSTSSGHGSTDGQTTTPASTPTPTPSEDGSGTGGGGAGGGGTRSGGGGGSGGTPSGGGDNTSGLPSGGRGTGEGGGTPSGGGGTTGGGGGTPSTGGGTTGGGGTSSGDNSGDGQPRPNPPPTHGLPVTTPQRTPPPTPTPRPTTPPPTQRPATPPPPPPANNGGGGGGQGGQVIHRPIPAVSVAATGPDS